ncbi:Hsp70 family protein [Mariniblastus sp.]|nr:Hsp70 family protein [Mariniblastus sp.]
MENPEVSVGIDLGTTFSAVAHLDSEGRPLTIINSEGELTTPSAVFFDHDAVIVGTEATIAGESDTDRLARNAKRDMGGHVIGKKSAIVFFHPRSSNLSY